MEYSVLNGTRLGTFVHSLLFLTGLPTIIQFQSGGELKEGARAGHALESLISPNPHPEDPLNVECHGVLGCFRVRYPRERGFHLFPLPIKIMQPTICLQVDRGGNQKRDCQLVDMETIPDLLLSPGPKSYWIAHGYLDRGHGPWTQKLTDELLEFDPTANVYIIDWGRGAEPPYSQATVNVELLGAYVGHLMRNIQEVHGLRINETHFIGHSLGAHFGGFTGSWLKERGFQLGRISGLDPAQPYFQSLEGDVRLDPTDALFVDVIHTDAKPLLAGGTLTGLGTQEPCGHVDFYPNNGKEQPGCKDGVYQAILQESGSLLYGLRRFIGCDHIRSYEIFIESIRSPCLFMSFGCRDWESFISGHCSSVCQEENLGSCNRMGFHAKKPTNLTYPHPRIPGGNGNVTNSQPTNETNIQPSSLIYFAITGSRSPYCREHYRLSFDLDSKSLGRSSLDLNLLILGEEGVLDKLRLSQRRSDSYSLDYVVPGHGFSSPVERVLLKPSVTSPLSWLVNRMVGIPEVRVRSISLNNMERNWDSVVCPSGVPYLRLSEEAKFLILTSSACSSSPHNSTL